MTLPDYDAWIQTLSRQTIMVAGVATEVRCSDPVQRGRKTCVLVHGLNGDFHGLVPVGYELRETYSVVFVDLPGHGASAFPRPYEGVETIRQWAQALCSALRQEGIATDVVVGHSFGCFVAQESDADTIVLLNPPFSATALSRNGSRAMRWLHPITGRLYHTYPSMVWRGKWLLHDKSDEAVAIVKWSSRRTRYTWEQIVFQSKLGNEAAHANIMDMISIRRHASVGIVLGGFDRVVDGLPDLSTELPGARVLTLPTNHVSVFERHRDVAQFISDMGK